jgi:2,3-bisphosphoglycerate-dependent phosphoglycerate mutase
MSTLLLVRHGQSQWNLENRFTGWVDVELTPQGETEALNAGKALKKAGYVVDTAFVSPLKRARKTAALLQQGIEQQYPSTESPEIIERFYGGLTGLDKTETAEKYGAEQVHIWRRRYDIAPPPLPESSEHHPKNNPSFAEFPFALPATESLKDVVARVTPFYNTILKPLMRAHKTVLLVAHGNSIRALIKEIEQLDEEEIQAVEILTATPVVLVFDEAGKFVRRESMSGDYAHCR